MPMFIRLEDSVAFLVWTSVYKDELSTLVFSHHEEVFLHSFYKFLWPREFQSVSLCFLFTRQFTSASTRRKPLSLFVFYFWRCFLLLSPTVRQQLNSLSSSGICTDYEEKLFISLFCYFLYKTFCGKRMLRNHLPSYNRNREKRQLSTGASLVWSYHCIIQECLW